MIPQTIGRYRIKAELGRGGMSTVYLAHDPHFDRDVAVKLLPLELLHQSTFRRRFEREAKVVAALDHPAIVPVYDFGEEDSQPFLVMRFMTGGSLADRLKQGPLTTREAAHLISHLAPALDEVHRHGVVHRDLKPSNILFDQRNEPYISDFGTAKVSQAQTKLTDTGGAVGTPAYMSPEQIQGEAELDGRSDIYTLGIILFEMLTGRHPFQTNTPIAIAVKHMYEPVPVILDVVPNLPRRCQEIIARAMAKKPEQRYASAQDFATAVAEMARLSPADARNPAAAKESSGRRYALIISNSEYSDSTLAQLARPDANVDLLAQVLCDPTIGRFDEVTTLQNESNDAVRRAIAGFQANKQPQDLLLLYFMGHAALGTRGRLYLLSKNTEPDLLRGTAIPATFIADEMNSSLATQQLLILDCTFSDTVASEAPGLIGRAVNTGDTFASNGRKRVIVTANDCTQYNWSKGAVRGYAAPSRFTTYFVQGLLHGAADSNQDGTITVDELFAYVHQQLLDRYDGQLSQVPRKWTPFGNQDNADLIIAYRPRADVLAVGAGSALSRKATAGWPAGAFWQQRPGMLPLIGAALLLLFLIVAGMNSRPAAIAAVSPVNAVTAVATQTSSQPSVTPFDTKTPTAPATTGAGTTSAAAPTVDGATATITAQPSPAATQNAAAGEITATARLSSSIFSQPDADSVELAFIDAGESVQVIGHSAIGDWLYVRSGDGVEGFVYGPRLNWSGDREDLPIFNQAFVSTTSAGAASGSCQPGACPTLRLDLYPLPGTRCEGDNRYRTVFMRGQGGDGRYTYYWNGRAVTGTLPEGYGFEVRSINGSKVFGTGRVVSGDGQTAEKALQVSDFICDP